MANETKDNKRVYKKKLFHVIFGFFGWETHPGLRYKLKKIKFCMQIFFFVKVIFQHRNKFVAIKGIKNFLPQIFIFVYE